MVMGSAQDNLIHSVFIVLFLGTVMQPARLVLIRMVLLYSSAALLVLYTWYDQMQNNLDT